MTSYNSNPVREVMVVYTTPPRVLVNGRVRGDHQIRGFLMPAPSLPDGMCVVLTSNFNCVNAC